MSNTHKNTNGTDIIVEELYSAFERVVDVVIGLREQVDSKVAKEEHEKVRAQIAIFTHSIQTLVEDTQQHKRTLTRHSHRLHALETAP